MTAGQEQHLKVKAKQCRLRGRRQARKSKLTRMGGCSRMQSAQRQKAPAYRNAALNLGTRCNCFTADLLRSHTTLTCKSACSCCWQMVRMVATRRQWQLQRQRSSLRRQLLMRILALKKTRVRRAVTPLTPPRRSVAQAAV